MHFPDACTSAHHQNRFSWHCPRVPQTAGPVPPVRWRVKGHLQAADPASRLEPGMGLLSASSAISVTAFDHLHRGKQLPEPSLQSEPAIPPFLPMVPEDILIGCDREAIDAGPRTANFGADRPASCFQ
jgi:hypothetical protein